MGVTGLQPAGPSESHISAERGVRGGGKSRQRRLSSNSGDLPAA